MQHLNEFTFSHIQGKHCLSIMPRFKNVLSSAQNLVKQWNWLLWKSCLGQSQGLQSISNKRGAWFCKTGEMYWKSLLYEGSSEDLIEKKETDRARLKQPGSLRCLMDTGLMKQKRLWPGKRVSPSSPPPPPFSSLKLFFGLFPVLAPLLDRLHFHIRLSLFLSLFFSCVIMPLASLWEVLPAVCCLPALQEVTEEMIILRARRKPPTSFASPPECLIADHSNFPLLYMLECLNFINFFPFSVTTRYSKRSMTL